MARPKSHKSKYCFHKTSGRAFVRIADRQIWLGKYGSQESKDKYDAVVGQWISQGRPQAAPFTMPAGSGITIIELAWKPIGILPRSITRMIRCDPMDIGSAFAAR